MRASIAMGRLALPLIPLFTAGLALAGCPGEAPPPKAPEVKEIVKAAPPPPELPPPYLLADPDAQPRGTATLLDDGAIGVLAEGARLWTKGAALRIAADLAPSALAGAERIPAWLGGGFLFRTRDALYRTETFDGALTPLISVPAGVQRVSFGPRGALLRASGGQRWMVEMPSGSPVPIAPIGLIDFAALADGRAAALCEGARLSISTDRGEHWADRTAQLAGAPASVSVIAGELWIGDEGGKAYNVEAGGGLKDFDRLPTAPPIKLRPRDPAWHGTESPLVAAVRRGAKIDESSALVIAGGDLVRVELRTGAIKLLSPSRLPPDLPCELMRAGDDLLAVCATPRRPSLVVSGLLGEKGQRTEKTFPVDGPFYANDDGTLAFGGSCDGVRMRLSVCTRDTHGEWVEHNVDVAPDAGADAGPTPKSGADAGEPLPNPEEVGRWIPRAEGGPLGIIGGKVPGTYDPVSGVVRAFRKNEDERRIGSDLTRALQPQGSSRAVIIDRSWSVSEGGTLHGWLDGAQAVTISPAGDVERSAFTFPRSAVSGALGFAFDRDGRAFQTLDRGESWIEIAAPPLSAKLRTLGPQRCSPVGCELGAWVRLGWDATPPVAQPEPPPPVALPPSLPHPRLRELLCMGAGEERISAAPQTQASPEDNGLGARKVPANDGSRDPPIVYKRRFFARTLRNPAQGATSVDSERPALALIHGYYATFNEPGDPRAPFDGITVMGPQKDPASLRRTIDVVEPFDPAGAVRSVGFTLRDLLPLAKSTGLPLGRLFASEGPDIDELCPVLPLDPAGAGGLVVSFPSEGGQFVATVSGGSSPRFKIAGLRGSPDAGAIISAVEIAGGEIVALTVLGDSAEEIIKINGNGISLVDHLPAPPSADLYPENPDALAVGPQGALAVLRLPSASDPASAGDPALLLPLGGGPPLALAPWSTLLSADDPACRGDASGYRALIHTASPWLRLRGAPTARDPVGVMSARVRWGASRVCLEALELPEAVRPLRTGEELETEIVVRFVGPGGAGRVAFAPGAELHQPLSCTLAPL
jgi:hypothetical protein